MLSAYSDLIDLAAILALILLVGLVFLKTLLACDGEMKSDLESIKRRNRR